MNGESLEEEKVAGSMRVDVDANESKGSKLWGDNGSMWLTSTYPLIPKSSQDAQLGLVCVCV